MGFRDCPHCRGRGCNQCIYYYNLSLKRKNSEEDEIKPLFVGKIDNERDMELLKNAIGRESLERAGNEPSPISRSMNPVDYIEEQLLIASLLQAINEVSENGRSSEEANEAEVKEPARKTETGETKLFNLPTLERAKQGNLF